MLQLQFMIEKSRPDDLTLSTTFLNLSVSRNRFSKAEMRQFDASENIIKRIWEWLIKYYKIIKNSVLQFCTNTRRPSRARKKKRQKEKNCPTAPKTPAVATSIKTNSNLIFETLLTV